jgi:hypothetical protein
MTQLYDVQVRAEHDEVDQPTRDAWSKTTRPGRQTAVQHNQASPSKTIFSASYEVQADSAGDAAKQALDDFVAGVLDVGAAGPKGPIRVDVSPR